TSVEVAPTTSLPEGITNNTFDEIVADASQRTGVPPSEIEVVSSDPETFNDASLGCPEPGRMYAQVITDGFVVLVDADGVVLDYRVAKSAGSWVFCK
ncbi:MAG: hypothetical protein R3264_05525, partial [Anaerolineae bacterium]|nr:hypothetical protein [Anaerolineae bacterium]